MLYVLIAILLLPTVAALVSRSVAGALGAGVLPGAIFLFSLFRLWEFGRETPYGACGMGAGIVFFVAAASGLSVLGPLLVALLGFLWNAVLKPRPKGGLEFYAGSPEIGFSPDPQH